MANGGTVRWRVLTAVADTASSTTTFTGEAGDGDVQAVILVMGGAALTLATPALGSRAMLHVTGPSAATVRAVGWGADTGADPDNASTISSSDRVALAIDGSGVLADYATFNARTLDGFQLQWNAGANPGVAYRLWALVLFAEAAEVAVDIGDDTTPAVAGTAKTITLDPAFNEEPELVFCLTGDGAFNNTAERGWTSAFGFAYSTGGVTPTITQCGSGFSLLDNVSTPDFARLISDQYALALATPTGAATSVSSGEVTDTGVESFEITMRNGVSAMPFAYLTVSTKGNVNYHCGMWDASRLTGTISNTNPGFLPQAYLTVYGLVNYVDRNTDQTGNVAATESISAADDVASEATAGHFHRNAVGGAHSHGNSDTSVVQAWTNKSNLTWEGTHLGMTSTGFQQSITNGVANNSGVCVFAAGAAPLVVDLVLVAAATGSAPAVDVVRQTTLAVTAAVSTAVIGAQPLTQSSVATQAGGSTSASVGQRVVQGSAVVSASLATVSVSAGRLLQASAAPQAGNTASAASAQRVIPTAAAVTPGLASASISAVGVVQASATPQASLAAAGVLAVAVSQTSVSAQAGAATATITGTTPLQASVGAAAGAAAVVSVGARVAQASFTGQAVDSATAIGVAHLLQTGPTVQTGVPSVLIGADRIVAAGGTVQSGVTSTAVGADKLSQTDAAAQADAATTSIAGVVDTGALITATAAVAADPAVTGLLVQLVRLAAVPAASQGAAALFGVSRIIQTSPAPAASAATVGISTTYAVQASAAGAALAAALVTAAIKLTQASAAPQGGLGSTAAAVQLLRVTSVSVAAGVGLSSSDVTKLSQTTLVVQALGASTLVDGDVGIISGTSSSGAGAAATLVNVDILTQAGITLSQGLSGTSIPAQRLIQGAVGAQAAPAAIAITVDRLVSANAGVQAVSALTALIPDKISQTATTSSAGPATAFVVAEIVGSVTGVVVGLAEVATTTVPTQAVHQSSSTPQADLGAASLSVQRLVQTTLALQAAPASAGAAGAVVQSQGSVVADQAGAVAALVAQRVVQASAAPQASPAGAALATSRLSQALVAVQAAASQAAVGAQRLSQTALVLQAATSSAAINGTTVQVEASVSALAGLADLGVSARKVIQSSLALGADPALTSFVVDQGSGIPANVTADAGAAVSVGLGQRVVQSAVAAACAPATVSVQGSVGANFIADVAVQASLASAIILGQRILQASVAVQAPPAVGRARDQFPLLVPVRPFVVYAPLVYHPTVLQTTHVLFPVGDALPVVIAAGATVQAGVAATQAVGIIV